MSTKAMIVLIGILFLILISIQYTLNLILREIRQLRIRQEEAAFSRIRDFRKEDIG